MTLQERIAGLERDLLEAKTQVAQWTETGLRIEGGLLVLRKLASEENHPPAPVDEHSPKEQP